MSISLPSRYDRAHVLLKNLEEQRKLAPEATQLLIFRDTASGSLPHGYLVTRIDVSGTPPTVFHAYCGDRHVTTWPVRSMVPWECVSLENVDVVSGENLLKVMVAEEKMSRDLQEEGQRELGPPKGSDDWRPRDRF